MVKRLGTGQRRGDCRFESVVELRCFFRHDDRMGQTPVRKLTSVGIAEHRFQVPGLTEREGYIKLGCKVLVYFDGIDARSQFAGEKVPNLGPEGTVLVSQK